MQSLSGEVQEVQVEPPQDKPRRYLTKWLIGMISLLAIGLILIFSVYRFFLLPPANFPLNSTLEIKEGMGLYEVAVILEAENYIHSRYLLLWREYWRSEPLVVLASKYSFAEPLTLPELEKQLSTGDFTEDLVHLTFTEGSSVADYAELAAANLKKFNASEFVALAKESEGRLFPDTYHVPQDQTPSELLKLLSNTFTDKQTQWLLPEASTTLTLDEVVILASILEREANDEESMKMVSGILQNRLAIGMPLQVDATMEYILDKPLKNLTPDDLKIDSPYNTYLYKGLPPTAIGNPGLVALKAVVEPTNSDYLFYITGNDGKFYYAKNFDEHRLNIARYLR